MKISFKNLLRILTIISVFLPAVVFGDVVHLRNGRQIEGRIINQSRTSVTLETLDGKQTLSKDQVKRIVYRDFDLEKERERLEEEQKRINEEKRRKAEEQKRQEEERLKRENERQREERERREEAERKARAAREQAARLKKLRVFIQGEESVWNQMHVDLKTAPGEEPPAETALLENPEIMTGGAPKSKLGALIRSAILPGWGQYYLGRETKSLFWGTTFLTGALIASSLDARAVSDLDSLNTTQAEQDLFFSVGAASGGAPIAGSVQMMYANEIGRKTNKANKSIQLATGALGITSIIYITNLIDIYADFDPIDIPYFDFLGKPGEEKTLPSAMWRSALFPGWGQGYQGRGMSGSIWATSFLFTTIATANSWSRTNREEEKLNQMQIQQNLMLGYSTFTGGSASDGMLQLYYSGLIAGKSGTLNNQIIETNSLLLLTGLIYAGNLFDVWYNHDRSEDAPTLTFLTDGKSMGRLALTFTF